MGLRHPESLAAWSRWQKNSSPYRVLRTALSRPAVVAPMFLAVRGQSPQLLIALDATTPTSLASYLRPLTFLGDTSVAVLAPENVLAFLPGNEWQSVPIAEDGDVPTILSAVAAVLAAGHFLRVGAQAFTWATWLAAKFVVAQHGVMTPFAPPLPAGAHVLSFSASDAAFWATGRTDTTYDVVGSQLLWEAGRRSLVDVDLNARPIFLGQLHGAELPRRGLAKAATSFCRATGATYRPHPSEVDKLSRFQHRLWQRHGVVIDQSRVPLIDLASPVVSVFSTGVLEAAARGIPSWVYYKSPPRWLEEFWDRNCMSRWGTDPTPPPVQPALEPAETVACVLQGFLKGPS